MPTDIVKRVLEAVEKRDIEAVLSVLEEADRVLTGKSRFGQGEYWRQFVQVDFERFFELLDSQKQAINTVKLGDEASKIYVNCKDGLCDVYLWAPEAVADTYEKIWNKIK